MLIGGLIRRCARDESGSMLLTVAMFLPVLFLFAGLVIGAGTWFEHKRHLQVQADAAALAGAIDWHPLPALCDNAPIIASVTKYAGASSGAYNQSVSGSGQVQTKINSATYFDQGGGPVDPDVNTAQPCDAGMVDVKMTEKDSPGFLGLPLIPHINAHARVQFSQADTFTHMLPLAVPNPAPDKVHVMFVDEDDATAAPLGGGDLTRTGAFPAGSPAALAGLAHWTGPVTFSVPPRTAAHHRIGMRVALSSGATTSCTDPLATCYPTIVPDGLDFVEPYDAATSGAAGSPVLKAVRLVSASTGTCPDPYFNVFPLPSTANSCNVGIQANLDFGSSTAFSRSTDITVKATIPNGPNNGTTLTYDSTLGLWTGNLPVSGQGSAAPLGPQAITLAWSQTNGGTCTKKAPCTGTFADAQSSFAGSASASAKTLSTGPVQYAHLDHAGDADGNALPGCTACSATVTVTLGIQDKLRNATSVDDPLVKLRISTDNQTQSLDCDPAIANFKTELQQGCAPSYVRNDGTTPCTVDQTPLSSNPTPPVPGPWQCVALDTGAATNQVPEGLNLRILGASKPSGCTHDNRWTTDFPNFDQADPRVVFMIVTNYNAFGGTGSGAVPVMDLAAFYITGWSGNGSGFNHSCPNDDPTAGGDIVGHFIKFVQLSGDGGTGDTPCDPNAFTPCISQLTR